MIVDLKKPIPAGRSIEGWKNIPILENDEPLVILDQFAPDFIAVSPQYYFQKIPNAVKTTYCRESVARRLLQAAKSLPQGYKLLIWDAWRPIEVQQALFDSYKKQLQEDNNLEGAALSGITEKYVSRPSTDLNSPSPHLTGGSIDLTILEEAGKVLNMGTVFDYFGVEAQSDYYEQKEELLGEELEFRTNRRLLYNALIFAGFTNYPNEWWHFDYGNQFWGVQVHKNAMYNKIVNT